SWRARGSWSGSLLLTTFLVPRLGELGVLRRVEPLVLGHVLRLGTFLEGERRGGRLLSTDAQHAGHGLLDRFAVRVERGDVHRVVPRVHAGSGERGEPRTLRDTRVRELALADLATEPAPVREDERAERRGDE